MGELKERKIFFNVQKDISGFLVYIRTHQIECGCPKIV